MAVGCNSTTLPSDNAAGSGSQHGESLNDDGGGEGSAAVADGGYRGSSASTSGSAGSSGSASGSGAPGGAGSGSAAADGGSGTGDAGSTVPDGSSPSDSGGGSQGVDGGLPSADASAFPDQFQQHNLDVINMYRAGGGLRPLTLDATLSAFALAGSQELTQDHIPHQHFMAAGKTLFTPANGFKTSAGENQGDPNGWTVTSQNATTNELTQIDQIMKAMFDEGPAGDAGMHGHYLNIMSATFTRVGVGLIEVSGRLYLTNDFSN